MPGVDRTYSQHERTANRDHVEEICLHGESATEDDERASTHDVVTGVAASTQRFLPQALVALILALTLILAAAAVVVALGLGRTSSSPPTARVLNWSNEAISDISTLDPAVSPDLNARQATQLIFGGLVRFGDDFTILPDAASSWTVSPDGRTYTFSLRPHIAYADGTPLTAQDVAFSLDRALGPQFKRRAGPFLFRGIVGARAVTAGRAGTASGIRVLNARTIGIRLGHADGSFLAKLANPAGYIVPPRQIEKDPKHWQEHAFGTGPFMVSHWVHHDRLLLAPNPHYWAGKLQITGIDMAFIKEPLAAYKRYRAGAVDIMGIIRFPSEALYEAKTLPDFKESPRLETVFLSLNERTFPFNKLRVRQALAQSVDRPALIHEAYGDFAHPTNSMLPPGIVGYNPRLPGTEYDPQRARRLLAAAGFPGGRGLPPITYAVDQDAQSISQATWLAAEWHRVLGIQIHLVQAPNHTVYDNWLQQGQYKIAVIDWTADFPDPSNFISQQFRSDSPNNNGDWQNQTFDRLVDQADGMVPQRNPRRLALYHQAESLAMEQAAAIPLANPYQGILLRPGIQGLQITGGQVLASTWTRVTIHRSGSQS